MGKVISISDEEKWKAVISCDKNYDGLFCYGVKTTGIFCRPSCRAKNPSRSNVLFFDDADKAMELGFRPCKKCCPDKQLYEPNFAIINKARSILDTDYDKPINVEHISAQLGLSMSHLVRLFKYYYGCTPACYIAKLRVNKAAELLRQSDEDILEIAYMSGFKSLSNFYKCFKSHMGCSPSIYRKKVLR